VTGRRTLSCQFNLAGSQLLYPIFRQHHSRPLLFCSSHLNSSVLEDILYRGFDLGDWIELSKGHTCSTSF